ncbi:magnesium transporter [Neptunomonas phycophila]|jgi:magnesium transporter|uniref:Magnesium transporter MgtE n=1 Tax=Neptunomonas phycophila TaxID=1572645 RepID=A0AAW7XEX1_9GAMM|nr:MULTISPECIES: magnesium transporter [Neptunomonas]MBT3146925.1 magnesium transporter [Neptunomonas phycophila]MDN2661335.1 magnesium transporter [Neptunomonas sp. CHC150]MDO6452717.1 magnesium transporter [Neptunomonas phycophila]MDO6467628.1 magnesium transporter [Neptunomonas phycophila]MDO6783616.1 magnesium transporter [Neptunomonas phycophila]
MTAQEDTTALDKLNSALNSGAFQQVRFTLNSTLRPVEVAHLLEKSPPKERQILWNLIHPENEGKVLQYLADDIQADILSKMDADRLLAITETLDTDDVADVLQQLPERITRELLQIMDQQNRERIEEILAYPEDTAGGLMNTDTVTIRPDITVETCLRYIRRHNEIPEMTDSLFVVSRKKNSYIGTLPLTKLLVSDPEITIREIMNTDIKPIPADMPDDKVASLFEKHDLVSAPVINKSGKLLGRITIDDVVDVIREDADHSLMSMAGLDEDEDTFAPLLKTTRRRAVWLGINLLTALLASSVIGLFQDTIDKVVALAVLMPIVASMGGIAGSQTLTLMIRGQALGHVERSNARWLLNRELLVSLLNGIIWAGVVAAVSMVWFSSQTIGIVIGLAIVINLIVGALAGTLLPLVLKAWGIDPALAGSVLLTTITDVVGFFAFLGLATYFYG